MNKVISCPSFNNNGKKETTYNKLVKLEAALNEEYKEYKELAACISDFNINFAKNSNTLNQRFQKLFFAKMHELEYDISIIQNVLYDRDQAEHDEDFCSVVDDFIRDNSLSEDFSNIILEELSRCFKTYNLIPIEENALKKAKEDLKNHCINYLSSINKTETVNELRNTVENLHYKKIIINQGTFRKIESEINNTPCSNSFFNSYTKYLDNFINNNKGIIKSDEKNSVWEYYINCVKLLEYYDNIPQENIDIKDNVLNTSMKMIRSVMQHAGLTKKNMENFELVLYLTNGKTYSRNDHDKRVRWHFDFMTSFDLENILEKNKLNYLFNQSPDKSQGTDYIDFTGNYFDSEEISIEIPYYETEIEIPLFDLETVDPYSLTAFRRSGFHFYIHNLENDTNAKKEKMPVNTLLAMDQIVVHSVADVSDNILKNDRCFYHLHPK
ncbi:MAG: hypothetical protein GY730_02835 [bacterium]|nr:hypothetical protein [bacterium]